MTFEDVDFAQLSLSANLDGVELNSSPPKPSAETVSYVCNATTYTQTSKGATGEYRLFASK